MGGSFGGGSFGGISVELPTPITFYFNFKIKTVNLAGVVIPGLKVEVTFDTSVSGLTDNSGIFQAPRYSRQNTSSASIKIKITDPAGIVVYDATQTISSTADFVVVPVTIDRYFVVRGKAILPDNSPLPKLKIEAVDKTLGLSTPLAPPTLTSETGQYEIIFWTDDLATRGRTVPNIVVRVTNPKGELIATSDMVLATGLDEINFTINPEIYGGPGEFDRFYKIVQPSLDAIQQGGIDANDLVLLSNMTGGDISQMNHLMDAIRLSDKVTGIGFDAEWLYGLFRRGLPSTPSQLANVSREKFNSALKDAVDLNIISNNVFAEADAIYTQILKFKTSLDLVSIENPEAESMLGFVLSCSGISQEKQATLYLAYLTAEKKDDSFWTKAFNDGLINADQLNKIPLYLKLAFVCEHERGIFEILLSKYNPSHINNLSPLGYNEWFEIVQEARVKNKIPGIHPNEDAQFVSKLLNNVYGLIPTAVLLYLVKEEQTIRDNAWYYLEDNIFLFDFKDQNINQYIDLHPETLDKYKNDIENLRRSLNRIQRAFLLTPVSYRPVLTKALLDLNLDAASKILRIGEITFVKYYREGLQLANLSDKVKEEHANLIFQRARKQANLIRHLHSTYGTSFNNLPMYAVQQNDDRRKVRVHIPGLSTLFEDQEIMGCDDCSSVLSPSAYLVDLLSFLDEAEIDRSNTGVSIFNETALDILFERRPDIKHLVLNCENTNTPVSYVDLVNEVLENAIAFQLKDETSKIGVLQYQLRGKIVNTTTGGKQVPVKDAYVQLFSDKAGHQELLGSSKTDRYGKFEINLVPENNKPLKTVVQVIYQQVSLDIRKDKKDKVEWNSSNMYQERLFEIDFLKLDSEDHPKQLSYLKENGIWTMSGCLMDPKTGPLQKYTVMAWDEDYGGDDLLGMCETDEKGNFEINFHSSAYMDGKRDTLPDPYIVVINDARIIYLQYLGSNVKDNLDLGVVSINAKTRSVKRISASPHRLQTVSGTIKGATAAPLSGLRVILTNDSLRPEGLSPSAEFAIDVTATDTNGNFTIFFDESEWKTSDQQIIAPNTYKLLVKASDSLSWIFPAVVNTSSSVPATSYPISNYTGAPPATGDRITGKLTNQYDGKPVQGYLIEVWRAEDDNAYWVGNAVSSASGEFTIPTQSLTGKTQVNLFFKLFEGDNFLYQSYPKLYDVTVAADVRILRAEIINPYYGNNVVVDPLTLRGRILDEKTSMPLQNTQIAFWEKDKGREYAGLQFGTRTDENGNFEIKFGLPGDLIPGPSHTWLYKIFLKDRISFEPSTPFKWAYKEREKQLDIKLDTSQYSFGMAKEYYTIRGKLTNKENGQPLRGCRVEAWDKDENDADDLLGIAKTDLNGDYEIIFDSHYFRDRIEDNDPDIYFLVYQGTQLLSREEVMPDVNAKVIMKDLEATPLERLEVTGKRGPLQENVYKALSETFYPWNFPFNLHEAEGSLYLKHLGINKEQLIVALNPGKDTQLGEALAFLQMSREELGSLKTTSVKLLYSLGDDEPVTKLHDVPFILNTIRISYDTLKELILTDYVNPLRKEILFLSNRTLLELSRDEYLNLHRLSRIKSKCNWEAPEIEQIIRLHESRFGELKGSTIDNFIIYIAGFKKLVNNGATIPDVLSWQYDLHKFRTTDGELYFNKIFNAESSNTTNGSASVLLLNASGQDLANPGQQMLNENGQLSELTSLPIMVALGIEANSLLVLIRDCLNDSKINLVNLSRLYRVVSFCRYLGIGFDQYKNYVACIGIDPLIPIGDKEFSTPEKLLKFIREVDFIRNSGLALYNLRFLYTVETPLPWSDETRSIFHSLRDACLKESQAVRSGTVIRKLSELLDMPEDLCDVLLNEEVLWENKKCKIVDIFTAANWFESQDSQPAEFLFIIDWLKQWFSLAIAFELTTTDVTLILQNGSQNGWYRPLLKGLQTDKVDQNFISWKMLVTACTLNKSFRKKNQPALFQVLNDVSQWAGEFPSATKQQLAAKKEKLLDTVGNITGWNIDDLRYLTTNIHQWQFPADFFDTKWFDRLAREFRFLTRSGLLPSQIPQMQSMAFNNINAAQSNILQMALKSKTPPGQWDEKINQLKDQIREGQRNALQTYLLSRDPSLQNEDDIYAQYLVDTEIGTAVRTSRIKQSISSVQLLVQRIRMGLEPGLSFKREDMKEWEWRKNYRVWEANRKIFLYPENWLEPELRDDKSQFFKKFEEELMQGEMNTENVERAFRNYLLSVDTVANLEISGFCYQEDGNIYHIFARTRNIPHTYFYRKWTDEYYWTPWEEVQLDIAGEHLIPAYWNRKLLLFWPSFTEKADESNASSLTHPGAGPVKGTTPSMLVEVKMSMSQRQDDGWTAKKLSEVKLRFQYTNTNTLSGEPTYPFILFQTATSDDTLVIRMYKENKQIGIFALSAGTTEITTTITNPRFLNDKTINFPLDEQKPFTFSKYVSDGQFRIMEQEIFKTPGSFSITTAPEQTPKPLALYYESKNKVYALQKVKSLPVDSVSLTSFNYRLRTFFHPLTGLLKIMLDRYGVTGLYNPPRNSYGNLLLSYLRPDTLQPSLGSEVFANSFSPSSFVMKPYPSEDLSFDLTDAYASYNWELFFHAPISIAVRLSENQKFEEAQQWFHYIFDPTETEGEAPRRFWRIKPFYLFKDYSNVADIIKALNSDKEEYTKQVENWEKDPFNPHVIARLRIVTYMRMVVMKYLDNLIAWGDQLFQRDTIESINEATQIYILASQILGKRPAFLQKDKRDDFTVEDIFDNLDNFSNALFEVENQLPNIDFMDMAETNRGVEDNANTFGSLLYFCIPQNNNLLGYWETVSDRLYKIRQGFNIEGVKRALALFEPPIDPAMLVKAGAQGVSLASAISETSMSTSVYRFFYLLPKAIEFCNEVKSLGGSLLSALEKRDAEEMALLRSTHEMALLKAVKEIKKKSIEEAETSIQSLHASLRSAQKRHIEYGRRIDEGTTTLEKAQMATTIASMQFKTSTVGMQALATGLSVLPTFVIGIAGAFGSPVAQAVSPEAKEAPEKAANMLQSISNVIDSIGSIIGTFASWERRKEDWQLQKDLANIELEQIQQQLSGAMIRKQSSILDLQNHEKQIAQAQEVRDLMESKYTNHQLYSWMVGQLSTVYFQSYQLAYDLAKKAEKAYAYELGVEKPGIIEFGYWDSLKKGLMSGEKLQLDLRRLEVAYMEQNKREFELTKHISMALFNSQALLDLKEKGICEFQIPEILFDLDHPSHYMRRIKSVSLTIPCIAGPYSGVHAQLTLLSSKVRKSNSVEGEYVYQGINDPRFTHDVSGIQSIATSSGQNDGGVFELNFRDERYLPFERAGAISTWRLELPGTFQQFNYDSISDVIIHLNYTAKEGGGIFKKAVEENIQTSLNAVVDFFAAKGTGLQAWISMKTDFSNVLTRLLSQSDNGSKETEIEVTTRHFPYFLRDRELTGKAWTVLVKCKNDSDFLTNVSVRFQLPDKKTVSRKTFVPYKELTLFQQADFKTDASPIGKWRLQFESEEIGEINPDNIEDIWLVSDYNIK